MLFNFTQVKTLFNEIQSGNLLFVDLLLKFMILSFIYFIALSLTSIIWILLLFIFANRGCMYFLVF